MPTYEYKCQACGHAFEKFQSMSSAAVKKCPVCGKNKVKRLIGTGAGLIFKGSGFYITDYRSEAYKQSAKDAAAASPSAPAEGTKKDGESKSTEPAKTTAETKPAAPAPSESKTTTPPTEGKGKSKATKEKS